MGTIIVSIILVAAVGAVFVYLYRNRKKGKCSCGECSMRDSCGK
ncbi:MAG: FeoB-associated Cys-rich membrane protein [Spirochaetaceae bacterium]|jgi:hypothetical protein|nr:FeoB-associated Cys-rich membrane protein [Spirochaetaceae bacterium]